MWNKSAFFALSLCFGLSASAQTGQDAFQRALNRFDQDASKPDLSDLQDGRAGFCMNPSDGVFYDILVFGDTDTGFTFYPVQTDFHRDIRTDIPRDVLAEAQKKFEEKRAALEDAVSSPEEFSVRDDVKVPDPSGSPWYFWHQYSFRLRKASTGELLMVVNDQVSSSQGAPVVERPALACVFR